MNPRKTLAMAEAHRAVRNAIRSGELVRRPCQECGEPRSLAHHADYAKPLDVRWLCFRCHSTAHGADPNRPPPARRARDYYRRRRELRARARGIRRCPTCGRTFIPARADATTCSPACRQKAYRDRARAG